MMTKEDWRSSLLAAIREFADQEFQERVWLRGDGPEVSSWEEAMNRLYDDCLLVDIIGGAYDLKFSKEQLTALACLNNELESFSKTVDEIPKPSAILDSPNWGRVRKVARAALNEFSDK